MTKLNYNPMVGTDVPLMITFKDSFGNRYVPSSVNYTFLAQNEDKQSWKVIDFEVEVEAESLVKINLENIKDFEGTNLQRKVIIKWTSNVDGEERNFVDDVSFEIRKQPLIENTVEDKDELKDWVVEKIGEIESRLSALENPTDGD